MALPAHSLMTRTWRAQVILLPAALLLAGGAHAQQEPWTTLTSPSPAFSVSAPTGWVLESIRENGARLVAPDGGLVVEVVTWDDLRPPATPEKAADQHEALLARAFDYRRRSEQWMTTDAGDQFLLITGTARAGRIERTSVFAAYAFGKVCCVLGTFCEAEELQLLRTSLLDKMGRSLRPGPPEVVEPPRPPEDTETDRPPTELEVEPNGEPVIPATGEQGVPWAQHEHALGFSVSLPADWRVSVVDGRILVAPGEAEPYQHGVVIWPVTGEPTVVRDAMSGLLSQLPLPGPGLNKLFENHGFGSVSVLGALAGDSVRVLASYAAEGADGLLTVAIAPADEFDEERGRLASVAGSFQPGNWLLAPQQAGDQEVTGESGLLGWRLPAGWESRGGAQVIGEQAAIDIEAILPGNDRLRVAWHQPVLPGFRKLTALLESLGWREGDVYGGEELSKGMLVYARRAPAQFVNDYLLARHPRRLTDVVLRSEGLDAAVAGLLHGPEAEGEVVSVRGDSAVGPRERLYVVATASMPPPLRETCWQAAELRAEAAEGTLEQAMAALAMMVRSARVAGSGIDPKVADSLRALLLGAQRSLDAIPADLLPARGQELPLSVLTGTTQGEGRLWVTPNGILQFWREQAALPGG